MASNDKIFHLDVKGSRRSFSPLHAEQEMLFVGNGVLNLVSMTMIVFEIDCSDLISMNNNLEEWLLFTAQLDDFRMLKFSFRSFSIRFIPSCTNIRTDCLGKMTRARDSLFFFVYSLVPDWFFFKIYFFCKKKYGVFDEKNKV